MYKICGALMYIPVDVHDQCIVIVYFNVCTRPVYCNCTFQCIYKTNVASIYMSLNVHGKCHVYVHFDVLMNISMNVHDQSSVHVNVLVHDVHFYVSTGCAQKICNFF
ncbi:unnamed protein product [Owenia fusiformis]|uniref:Uncharacterized protein n=1 Tax=Owenia fusiformis TaxID=6347 RepID=A0A8S4Q133_OWEFU|nr:unnamed protein product [Owenia fusiformis]